MASIYCYCNDCSDDEDVDNGTCLLKPGGQCFSAVEKIFNKEENVYEDYRSYGCFSDSTGATLQCKGDLVPSVNLRSIQCCNFTDFCNKYLTPECKPRTTISPPNIFFQNELHIFGLSIFFGFIVLSFSVMIFCYYNKYKNQKGSRICLTDPFNVKLQKPQNTVQDINSSSGSGVGKPLLIQTTISREFKRISCLGRGRFTEIYVGDWKAERIVEKVFSTTVEGRWIREKNVYETALLRHKNVLGYITSDILESGLRAIYTDYHKNGCLQDYLDKATLNCSDFFTLVRSAVTAIAHLHTEMFGTLKRPAVVHRDITSKNFLINNNKECIISNFEISIMHNSKDDDLIIEPDVTLGTPRYMAPELVNGTLKVRSFEALKLADIYSLGLVLYEICQRFATVEGNRYTVDEHTLPFFDVLPKNPSIDDMRELFEIKRPKEYLLLIPPRWENDSKMLKPFTSIMRECFYLKPKARPNALRLKKSIMVLGNLDSKDELDIL